MPGELKRGWLLLMAATLGMSLATTAIPFYSMGVFIAPLEAAQGWSRTDISLAISLFGFTLPVSMLAVGYAIERFGARVVIASGHLMLGLIYIALSFVGSDVWVFWALYVAAAVLAVGASPIAFTHILIRHFDRRRGLAIGICMSGAGLGAAVMPPLLGYTIAEYGWENGYRLLGAMILCLVPVALLGLRENAAGKLQASPGTDTGMPAPLSRSLSPAFLLSFICLIYFAVALSVNGYIVHLVPLMIDSGIGATRAAWIGGLMGLAVIFGRLFVGYLLDKMPVGLLGMAIFLLATTGIVLLDSIGANVAPLTAVLIGFTIGAEVDLVAYLISRLFRAADYARFFSRVYGVFMLGSGLSPLFAGWIVDRYGSYELFVRTSYVVLLLVSFAFLWLHLLWSPDEAPHTAK